jgi:hypothetical protein
VTVRLLDQAGNHVDDYQTLGGVFPVALFRGRRTYIPDVDADVPTLREARIDDEILLRYSLLAKV